LSASAVAHDHLLRYEYHVSAELKQAMRERVYTTNHESRCKCTTAHCTAHLESCSCSDTANDRHGVAPACRSSGRMARAFFFPVARSRFSLPSTVRQHPQSKRHLRKTFDCLFADNHMVHAMPCVLPLRTHYHVKYRSALQGTPQHYGTATYLQYSARALKTIRLG